MRRVIAMVLLVGLLSACSTWKATRLYASGTEALETGHTEEAIRDLEQAAELRPASGEVQNHLGIAYLQAGRKRDAHRAFARAVALNCTNPAARANLELLDRELGR